MKATELLAIKELNGLLSACQNIGKVEAILALCMMLQDKEVLSYIHLQFIGIKAGQINEVSMWRNGNPDSGCFYESTILVGGKISADEFSPKWTVVCNETVPLGDRKVRHDFIFCLFQ